MQLTQKQKKYFDKIDNDKLKKLISNSYMFLTMNDEEKNNFLIWMSVIHLDKDQETEVINELKKEAEEKNRLLSDSRIFKANDKAIKKQEILLKKQYIEMIKELKKVKNKILKNK
ncbi:hypothetical protein GF369_00160 [Candidatus Peregrinibacteria bacterium]|nr:hypothetical protein [Candidatus Peregrinibacteria bacterium]